MNRTAIGAAFAGLAATGAAAALPAAPPERETVTAVLRLSPEHRSSSVSRRFEHVDSGIESLRLVLPRGLHAELLIRNPVQSASRQPPSKMLCTPHRLCRDKGRTGRRFCHASGPSTICAYTTKGRAVFQPGRWVLTVRALPPIRARIRLRVTFGLGVGA